MQKFKFQICKLNRKAGHFERSGFKEIYHYADGIATSYPQQNCMYNKIFPVN